MYRMLTYIYIQYILRVLRLSPLQKWGSLTVFTGKFVCIAQQFILLQLNPFDLGADKDRWLFEYSVP